MTLEEKSHLIQAVTEVINHTKEWSHFPKLNNHLNNDYEKEDNSSLYSKINNDKKLLKEKEANMIPNKTIRKYNHKKRKDEVILLNVNNAIVLQRLRTRKMGPYLMVDVDIEVPPKISASAAHQVSEHIRLNIVKCDDRVNEVNVHVDPRSAQHFRPRRWKVNNFNHEEEENHHEEVKGQYQDDKVEEEDKINPLLPMPHIIEENIRQTIKKIPLIITKYDVHISEVQCYYVDHDKLHVKIDIVLPPHKSITEANRGV